MKQKKEKEIIMEGLDATTGQGTDLLFRDGIDFVPGCRLQIQFKEILTRTRSKFQEILILSTEGLGKVLVIDGITMLTEFDEFAYHEMIAHVPLFTHPKPSRVLVIGGEDGGTVREVVKHPEVEEVHLCEIDEEVVNVSRRHLPSLASALDDPRVKVFYEDGAKFVHDHKRSYEVIIVDSTDPFGPAQVLFQEPFYRDMKNALTEEGIAVTQCESLHLHGPIIRGVHSFARRLYPKIGYYFTLVPTYPSGIIGFMLCSLKRDPIADIRKARPALLKNCRYYTPEIHRAAFSLPNFAVKFFE